MLRRPVASCVDQRWPHALHKNTITFGVLFSMTAVDSLHFGHTSPVRFASMMLMIAR
jgi:hypothetical protein